MIQKKRAIGTVRLSDETNNLIYAIERVCENKNIKMNGDNITWSTILRYPFEKVAHAQFKEEKIEKLTDLLLLAHTPCDNFGNFLSREQVKNIVKEVFK